METLYYFCNSSISLNLTQKESFKKQQQEPCVWYAAICAKGREKKEKYQCDCVWFWAYPHRTGNVG